MDYTFEEEGGKELILLSYPIGKAPKIGSCVEVDGKVYRRVPDSPTLPDVINGCRRKNDRYFAARTLPDWVKHAPRHDMDPSSRTYGSALFAGSREVREFEAKCKDDPECQGVFYDGKL